MTTVFGNPGSTEMGFFRDWPEDLRYVLALQEASAVGMADGFAQATRNAAFVNLHSAAGLGNALGNVFTAYRNRTPLVLMAGQQHRAMFQTEPFLHADQADAFPRPYVKWSCEPARAADVPAAIARAYRLAMQAPRGPTFVSVPLADWDEPAEPVAERTVHGDPHADPAVLAEVAAAVDRSRRPVLVVGPAVDAGGGFHDAVRLAERIGAPAWASPRSHRASFPEDHPLFAGFLPFDRAGVREALAGHDLVLVLGAPVFTYHVHTVGPFLASDSELIQIDEDPAAVARAVVGTGVVGAVTPAIRDLAAAATERPRPAGPARPGADPPAAPADGEGMSAAFVLRRLDDRLPPDAIVAEEAPSHRHALHDHLRIRRPDSFYTGASGGLGWAMPAAVGLRLARPERPVVCLVGDGSAMYSPQALWSAARYDAPVVFVVMNNGGYGAMKGFAKLEGAESGPDYDLPGLDLGAVARGQGCAAETIRTPRELDEALDRALRGDRPTLLDVHLAPETPTVA